MALAKDHRLDDHSAMCLNHGYTYYESEFGGSSSVQGSDQSSPGLYGIDDQQAKKVFEEGDHSPVKNFAISNSSSLSSPSSSNSSGLAYPNLKYQSDEGTSVISFKAGYGNFPHTSGSLLSFEQNEQLIHQSSYSRMSNQEDFSIWEDNMPHNYQNQLNSNCSNSPTKMQAASSHGCARNGVQFGWISPELPATTSGVKDLGREEAWLNKRPNLEESTQPYKKQCTSPTKQLKLKSSPSKDPQSIAAKNRRERISERLKILQELVPNGSKVDLVTMLEKAIGYVKFLQLQVKVLATDEFWPAQGGKAPNLSQVKEAIDVILASQRDRSSSSK